MRISIVIPVKGDRGVLSKCLESALSQDYDDYEVIVVGDRMDEEAMKTVSQFSVKVVENMGRGVSAARNTGAKVARGEVVLFIDSDIILPRDALRKIKESLEKGYDGVVGLISEEIPYKDFFSRYKNLWMHYTYRILPEEVALFYTSCAAMKREKFLATGGFDENYILPSVEDTDFGRKVREYGLKVHCRKDLQVIHLKDYTFWETLKTDFKRSGALVKHILRNPKQRRTKRVGETSVPLAFMLSVPLSVLILTLLILSIVKNGISYWGLTVSSILLYLYINRGFIGFLYNKYGLKYMLKSCIFILIDIYFVDLGIVNGLIEYIKGDKY